MKPEEKLEVFSKLVAWSVLFATVALVLGSCATRRVVKPAYSEQWRGVSLGLVRTGDRTFALYVTNCIKGNLYEVYLLSPTVHTWSQYSWFVATNDSPEIPYVLTALPVAHWDRGADYYRVGRFPNPVLGWPDMTLNTNGSTNTPPLP